MSENYTPSSDLTCPATAYQSASVCVPVTVTPFAVVGDTVTKCCGDPVVTPGKNTCDGNKKGSCVFTITQDICVTVPVEFGASAEAGDTFVSCGTADSTDICQDCGSAEAPAVLKVTKK